MKKIKALIPVRSGSERVTNKNIRLFAGSSLLEIKITQLKKLNCLDGIIVNSDCQKMLEVAKNLGVETIQRDPYYASSHVPMNEVWANLAMNAECDSILYTNCTSPLVTLQSYESMINLYNNLPEQFDSITSVHRVKEYLWHENKAINYDPSSHPRSQDLPEYYGLNFAISIIKREDMIERKSILGSKFYPYFLSPIESMDIDTQDDFDTAEAIYEKQR